MSHATGTKYLKGGILPHMWCSGCGIGTMLGALLRAFEELGYTTTDTVVVTGIGCTGKADDYMITNALHTTHGRALAYATGIKAYNPKLNVVAIMGDGDGVTIGGNHFIHACRRNIGITAVVMNNNIYGMTGGQASPTTPEGAFAATAPYGAIDPTFDICKLAEGAGATYVARATVAQPAMCEQILKKAIQHQKKGFAVVELISFCHTQFGRKNKRSRPMDNINYLKDNSVMKAKADTMTAEELKGKIIIGEFVNIEDAREYTERYDEIIARAQKA